MLNFGAIPRHIPTHPTQNNFSLLRLIFASLVLVSHGVEMRDGDRSREALTWLFDTISFGEWAVSGFFLLSGFLIVQSWHRQPRLVPFLLKRAKRIAPGFFVASLLSVGILGVVGGGERFFEELDWTAFLLSLFTLRPPVTPPVFEPAPYAIVNGSMWTIVYEAICYLLVAFLGVLGWLSPRKLIAFLFFGACFQVFVIKTAPNSWMPQALQTLDDANLLRLVLTFFVGAFFFLWREKIVISHRRAVAASLVLLGAFWSGSTTLVWLAITTAGAYLLFWLASLQFSWLVSPRHWPDFSYGIYLYGWPVQKITLWLFPGVSPYALLPLQLLLSVICGALSWYAIERPVLEGRFRAMAPNPT